MVAPSPAPVKDTPRIYPARPAGRSARVFLFYSAAMLLTAVVAMLFADLLWRSGWNNSSTILLILFILLFLLISIGCLHGIAGFILRVIGDPSRITRLGDYNSKSLDGVSTAIVFPTYNEEVARIMEGLRATYLSLERTGQAEHFDFFILSDSTDPAKWVEEEERWCELVRELDALGRIYYRRRVTNEGKKSGNVRDFLSTWGRRYRYFIVFDADSIMRGELVVDLVKLMETHPHVGMIQTVPALVNAESLFGRIQQFANRLYAPIFIAGLNYWTQGFGNYWGHNAIIRTEPFMHYCDLPQLPGRKPFGGQILSHDFVEAALMLKENWQVWFAYDLEGSYEEQPQDMIENAQRDRRWCQGNLQHAMVLFARGLRGVSRIHLLLGIFGYLGSPLWLFFLLTYNWALWFKEYTRLSDLTVRAFTPFMKLSGTGHAFLIFSICMSVLFLPKVLALVDLAFDRQRKQSFGGLRRATLSAVVETLFSSLHAPLQMLWHSKFVATILFGLGVNWGPQKRGANGITWSNAVRAHLGHTLLGIVWGWLIWRLDPPAFWWFLPVLAGMLLSIPLSVVTSRPSIGAKARSLGLFLTPEETAPPSELDTLRMRMALLEKSAATLPKLPDASIAQVVLDPYVNAIHVSLLREKGLNPEYSRALKQLGAGEPRVRELAEQLLRKGPESLEGKEKALVLSDAEVMPWLHRQAWIRSAESLAPWWQTAIRHYVR
ncbi:MAG TPA: glucans biosynthesis glucosyltransferase MdoH [Verrucomicrobiae bacterium]|nr:glucans biosynthesis glucosyltransferase MdoH [Verrucomicrobiae bacterium]